MKQWEQIAFAVALAAFGWLLYKGQTSITKSANTGALTSISSGLYVPSFYSLNQQTLSYARAPGAADFVPLQNDSAGQDNANGYQSNTLLWPA